MIIPVDMWTDGFDCYVEPLRTLRFRSLRHPITTVESRYDHGMGARNRAFTQKYKLLPSRALNAYVSRQVGRLFGSPTVDSACIRETKICKKRNGC